MEASPALLDGALCHSFHSAEMEMVRESRARDKEEGVDRNACIVDRNQFFNTQVTCNNTHSAVVNTPPRLLHPKSNLLGVVAVRSNRNKIHIP